MNKRSEETTQPELNYLYPMSFKRGNPSTATRLHRRHQPFSRATTERGIEAILRHLIGKKAQVPLDIIFACRALFPETIGQIKANYQRDLIDVLKRGYSSDRPAFRETRRFLGTCEPLFWDSWSVFMDVKHHWQRTRVECHTFFG